MDGAMTPLQADEVVGDGYYWVRHHGPECDGTTFVALLEDGLWFVPGVGCPVSIEVERIIGKVKRLDH
jgi:hypothetical protein